MPEKDLTGDTIRPELGRQILAELAELNTDFVALVLKLEEAREPLLLPAPQLAQLRSLRRPAMKRLCGCAFALFDLRLQDPALYAKLRDDLDIPALSRTPGCDRHDLRRIRLFTLAALMYLRHLADVNRFFAKLSFGAHDETLAVIDALPLNRLRQIADRNPGLLRGRYADLPQAWDELVKLARRSDSEPLLPAKLLGYRHLDRTR